MGDLKSPLVIVSDNMDSDFQKLITPSLEAFYFELAKMIQDNDAKNFHNWFTERSYLSLFFNGIIRNDKDNKRSVIQEYFVYGKDTDDKGRCDGMMCDDRRVVLFEAKKSRYDEVLREDHFDMKSWVDWDAGIRKQLDWYYEQDKEFFMEGTRYDHCYLATIVFKVIKQIPINFCKKASNELSPVKENFINLPWYYSVAFLNEDQPNEAYYGIEVYGTVKKASVDKLVQSQ